MQIIRFLFAMFETNFWEDRNFIKMSMFQFMLCQKFKEPNSVMQKFIKLQNLWQCEKECHSFQQLEIYTCRNLNWELKFSSLIDSKYLACTYFHKSLYTLESQLIALILQRWGYIQVIQWLRWKSSHQICYSLRAKRIVGHRQL